MHLETNWCFIIDKSKLCVRTELASSKQAGGTRLYLLFLKRKKQSLDFNELANTVSAQLYSCFNLVQNCCQVRQLTWLAKQSRGFILIKKRTKRKKEKENSRTSKTAHYVFASKRAVPTKYDQWDAPSMFQTLYNFYKIKTK